MDKELAPIALFGYTRLDHLKLTVEALQQNNLASESQLYIFSDGPKNKDAEQAVANVRQYIKEIDGFKSVIINESESNNGLAKSIINGVTELVNKYGMVIVLEDDLTTTPNFLTYMNRALDYYEKKLQVWSVAGCNWPFKMPKEYEHDVYFFPRTSSWGWATWKNRWDKVEWDLTGNEPIFHSKKMQRRLNGGGDDMFPLLKQMLRGEVNSWAIIWEYHEMLNHSLTVWPVTSKVNNIGLDGSGEHGDNKKINFKMDDGKKTTQFIDEINIDEKINKNRLRYTNGNTFCRIKIYVKRLIMNGIKQLKNKK